MAGVVERNVMIRMIRPSLEDLPPACLADGFRERWYRAGDHALWLAVQRRAERYCPISEALFWKDFGTDPNPIGLRQLFIMRGEEPVATATAWCDDLYDGRPAGRVHWVAVVPELQGHGLGKVVLALVCQRLRALGHDRAYLVTSTIRVPAILLYQQFGFEPDTRSAEHAATWAELLPVLAQARRQRSAR